MSLGKLIIYCQPNHKLQFDLYGSEGGGLVGLHEKCIILLQGFFRGSGLLSLVTILLNSDFNHLNPRYRVGGNLRAKKQCNQQ